MTEQVPVWVTIFDAIEDEIAAVLNSDGVVAFQQVFQGEPLGLPIGGPYAAFWYMGRTDAREGRQTLGNIMYAARIQIACFWPIQPERATQALLEADIATVDTSIRRALRANSAINSNLTDLDITDSLVDYGGFPATANQIYRVLMFELHLDNLEGEAIVP
jgi:hypothetical protein